MLTTFLINLGLTRDSVTWFWSRVVSLALVISSGVFDLSQYGVTDREMHMVSLVSALVLFFAGKYDSSPLPGDPNKR